MDLEEVRYQLDTIRQLAAVGDYETAYGEEIDLYKDVLRAIMRGHEHPAPLAFEALAAAEIDFDRYTA